MPRFIEHSGATCQGQWYPKAIQGVGANRDEEMSNEWPVSISGTKRGANAWWFQIFLGIFTPKIGEIIQFD